MDLEKFARLRPFLYHLTSTKNSQRILADPWLKPASEHIVASGARSLLREKRADHVRVEIADGGIDLRDQRPLYEGNVALEAGWSFQDLLQDLNQRVYFWPGTERGPSEYGVRHFERYSPEELVWLIRVPTAALFAANPGSPPQFCRYNSGAPRCSGGKKSPRGPRTFLPAHEFQGTPSDVVEVTFTAAVRLPVGSAIFDEIHGPYLTFVAEDRNRDRAE